MNNIVVLIMCIHIPSFLIGTIQVALTVKKRKKKATYSENYRHKLIYSVPIARSVLQELVL